MKCPQCGKENRAGARFCAQCGAKLPEESAEPFSPIAAPPPYKPLDVKAPPGGRDEKQESKEESASAETAQPAGQEAEQSAPGPQPETEAPAPAEMTDQDLMGGEMIPEGKAEESENQADLVPDVAAAEGMPPLVPGSRLQDRYEIIEAVEVNPEEIVYAASDLARCPNCGFDENEPESEYCAECGATRDTFPQVMIREQRAQNQDKVEAQFAEGGFLYTVTRKESEDVAPQEELFSQRVRYSWGQRTDPGRARELNEDYVDARVYAPHYGSTLGLFIVADGVGGQEHGEVASELATQALWSHIREAIWEPELRRDPEAAESMTGKEMETVLREGVQAANKAVYDLRVSRGSDMGTTMTAALLRNQLAIIANVGDSRTYHWGGQGLERITVDHSVVETLVAAGKIDRKQVYTHPQRNLIYRSLGDRPQVEVDIFAKELEPGEALLLCSDGLWEMAHDDGIKDVLMRESDPQRACDELIKLANLAGGEDNISVVMVQVHAKT